VRRVCGRNPAYRLGIIVAIVVGRLICAAPCHAEGEWEITPASEEALERGLRWLAENQGTDGSWGSNDLGLVGLGALAFLSAGHTPGHGKYGASVDRAIGHLVKSARPSGLLNVADTKRDMYNHGLATFVLGQAYGMTNDSRVGPVLDRALMLIASTQCDDGGWDYRARRLHQGHDLSLVVMQAKALRSALDSGLQVSPAVTGLALKCVRNHYKTRSGHKNFEDPATRTEPGGFAYYGKTDAITLSMAACGIVCLQEFGQYDDWRIPRNVEFMMVEINRLKPGERNGKIPMGAYTMYYVGQALYQVGGPAWETGYPRIRDSLIASQLLAPGNAQQDGSWEDARHLTGPAGQLYGTAVACFILSIPNRYLPILQEGRIDTLKAAAPN
jgi:hypothetical protein